MTTDLVAYYTYLLFHNSIGEKSEQNSAGFSAQAITTLKSISQLGLGSHLRLKVVPGSLDRWQNALACICRTNRDCTSKPAGDLPLQAVMMECYIS